MTTDDMVRRSIAFPATMLERIQRASGREQAETGVRVTVSEWIREACEQRLEGGHDFLHRQLLLTLQSAAIELGLADGESDGPWPWPENLNLIDVLDKYILREVWARLSREEASNG